MMLAPKYNTIKHSKTWLNKDLSTQFEALDKIGLIGAMEF